MQQQTQQKIPTAEHSNIALQSNQAMDAITTMLLKFPNFHPSPQAEIFNTWQ